jgi:hypothetical protein
MKEMVVCIASMQMTGLGSPFQKEKNNSICTCDLNSDTKIFFMLGRCFWATPAPQK